MKVTFRLSWKWIVLAGLVLGFIFLRGMWPFHAILWEVYVDPITWILLAGMAVGWVLVIREEFKDDWRREKNRLWLVLALLLTIMLVGWKCLSGMVTTEGLYRATFYHYIDEGELPVVEEPRPVALAEAYRNFYNHDNDPRRTPHDLDFVHGEWISDFSPEGGFNPICINTSGFFVYNPKYPGRVRVIHEEFPWAESGWLWNGLAFKLHQVDPFMEYHEVLYVGDPETGKVVAVVGIIKRAGWRRYPYLAGVWLLYQDGSIERLSVREAVGHHLLCGVQIMPEWLQRKQAEALTLRAGIWGNVVLHNKIVVEDPVLNRENRPPYLLKTERGMMWFTPFTPAGAGSITGLVIQDAHNPGANLVYERGKDELAWVGVDSMAGHVYSAYEGAWERTTVIEGKELRTGVYTVQELVPAFRREGERVIPYFMGYVTPYDPVDTVFYVIVRPDTLEVGQKFYTIEEVQAFLRGEIPFIPVERVGSAEEGAREQQLLEGLERIEEELDHLRKLLGR